MTTPNETTVAPMAATVKVGDWVRFYRNGQLVIGEVRYIQPDRVYSHRREFWTDAGAINSDCVLEVRRTAPTAGEETTRG